MELHQLRYFVALAELCSPCKSS